MSFLLARALISRQFIGMHRHVMTHLRIAAIALGIAAAFSCRSTRPAASTPLSEAEKSALAKRGKPPQVFGLTAYSSPDGVIFAGGFRLHDGDVDRLAFVSEKTSTAPIIALEDGSRMLLDSTAGESWLTTDAAMRMKAVALKEADFFTRRARHVHDETGGMAVVVPTLIMDRARAESAVFFMRNRHGPLDLLNRWERTPPIDGVLGAGFLRAFKFVRISLGGRYAFFSATADYPASPLRHTAVPLVERNGGLAIEARVNGDPRIIMIDIAGDFEMVTAADVPETFRQISIGDAVFRQVEAIPGRELGLGLTPEPRIGRQLLEKYDIVINNFGKELILERPAAP